MAANEEIRLQHCVGCCECHCVAGHLLLLAGCGWRLPDWLRAGLSGLSHGRSSGRFSCAPLSSSAAAWCWIALFYLMHMLIISIVFRATKHLAVFQDLLVNYIVQLATLGTAIALLGTLYFVLIDLVRVWDPAMAAEAVA